MPLLREASAISAAQLRYTWEDVWPGRPVPGFEVRGGAGFVVTLGGVEVTGAMMSSPIPNREAQLAADTSWLWPHAGPELLGYRGHMVVAATGAETALLAHQAVTQVTAVLVRATTALGVYVGGAAVTAPGALFVELAQLDPLPIALWVDFRVMRSCDGSYGLVTTGLRQFGLMELEISTSTLYGVDLREWCLDVAGYLVRERPDLRNGHTIGRSAGEKVRVAHAPSLTGNGVLAYRLTGL